MGRRRFARVPRDELLKPPLSNWRLAGCTVLLTAAVAFPAGIFIARTAGETGGAETRAAEPVARSRAGATPSVRNPYSAKIQTDPYVLDQHRLLAEALERGCRQSGANCAEARAARRYLERQAD